MQKVHPGLILFLCVVITIMAVCLKFTYRSVFYFNSIMVVTIMLSSVLSNFYTRLFTALSIGMVAFSLIAGRPSLEMILPQLLLALVMAGTCWGVLYNKHLYRSVQHEKKQMNALFEYATEGIILCDQKGDIVLINPAALSLFKYEKPGLLGKPVELLIPDRFRENHTRYRKGFESEPSHRAMGQGRELFARTADGTEFPVEVSLSYFHQDNQFYIIVFVIDISPRLEAQQKLIAQKDQLERITTDIRRLNASLENKVEERTLILKEALGELERSQQELSEALNKEKELNDIKSRFVSMASHEFRTPLSTILSSAILAGKYPLTEQQDKREKHLRKINDSVNHLNDLLGDFLSLGKLDANQVKVAPEDFNTRVFIQEVCDEMKRMLKPGQEIQHVYRGISRFTTDKRLLKIILINLLSNAIKFSNRNSTIYVDVSNDCGQLTMAVRDEGIGIREDDIPHLFSTFFRGNNATNIEGTGLGLNIVKKYADLLGGEISILSELHKGTSFQLVLNSETLSD